MQSLQRDWWEAPPRPALLLVGGFVLGPRFLDVLHTSTLELLSPVVPVAIAALAVLAVLLRKREAMMESLALLAAAAVLLAMNADVIAWTAMAGRGWRAVQACGAAALVGVGGVLLLTGTAATARRVFVLAIVLLLGGIANFASAPALAVGATATALCTRIGPQVADAIRRDLEYVVRPLATGILLLTGAGLTLSETTLVLAAVWVLVALTLHRAGHDGATPGVYAVAVALDLKHGVDAVFAPLVDSAVVAVILVQTAMFIMAVDRAPALTPEGAEP